MVRRNNINIPDSRGENQALKFDCEKGEYKLPGTNVVIHDHEPHGILLLEEVLIHSSNIGTSKISLIIIVI